MTDETALSIQEAHELSTTLAKSTLIPAALQKKPEDVLTIVLTGAEMGLAPLQSLRSIQIISGKPSLSADLMGALVKRRPDVCEYLSLIESTSERATYRTKRKGEPEPTTITFTMEEAKQAGLAMKDVWKKHPQAMLRARALAAICRAVYPDVCMGLYDATSGELTGGQVVEGQIVSSDVMSDTSAMSDRIRAASTISALESLMPEIAALSDTERASLRDQYVARKAELQ